MKKIVASILLSMFLFQGSANAAPVITKNSCKPGTVKVDSKYKYTCLKSHVWKKVLLPVKKSPSVELPKKTPFDINNLTVSSVFTNSRKSINDTILKSTYEINGITFYIGSTISSSTVEAERLRLFRTAKLWSNIYKPQNNVSILFYNYDSLDWARSKASEISPNTVLGSASGCSISYCGNATAGKLSNGVWLIEQGLGGSVLNNPTSPHEYTHLAQTAGSQNYWNIAPLWLVEGMAQFYGEAVGFSPAGIENFKRLEHHRGLAGDYYSQSGISLKSTLEKNNTNETHAIMKAIEFPYPRYANGSGSLAYVLGGYATEVLVAVYGHESIEKFITSFESSQDWELNFKNSFGISKDEFYDKITPYLAEISKEL